MEENIASITGQIASSYAQQLDRHIEQFLRKNLIPFDGDIAKTNAELEAKGMKLIRQDDSHNVWGDWVTTYTLVKIIDSTTVTIKAPQVTEATDLSSEHNASSKLAPKATHKD